MKKGSSEQADPKQNSNIGTAGSPAPSPADDRLEFGVGWFNFGGPFRIVVSIILGFLLGAGTILFEVYYHQQPDFIVNPMISTAIAATAAAHPSATSAPITDQVAGSTPTETSGSFSIDQVPLKVSAYSGMFDSEVGKGMGILTVTRDSNSGTSYRLDYRLPEPNEGNGSAGMSLEFKDPQDWTAYKGIEVVISFEAEQVHCDIGIKDLEKNADYARLGDKEWYGADTLVILSGDTHTVMLPFAARFPHIKLKYVTSISFSVDSRFAKGNHFFTVDSLKLNP